MLFSLIQVLFAAIKAFFRSSLNIMVYSFVSRIFKEWLGLHGFLSFICSAYSVSKISKFLIRQWLCVRLRAKKPEDRLYLNEISWHSPTSIKTDNENESIDKFETDWQQLLDEDNRSLFSSIANIPFSSGYSYMASLIRVMLFESILLCGSTVRYKTLFDRERKKFFDVMIKKRDEIERYIVYSKNTIPIGLVCVQIKDSSDICTFTVQLYHINNKFFDYFYDIANFTCQKLIERSKVYANERKRSIQIEWSLPTCKIAWRYAINANKFVLKSTYEDFSFLPFVGSNVEEYEYKYEYKEEPSQIVDETTIKE